MFLLARTPGALCQLICFFNVFVLFGWNEIHFIYMRMSQT